MDKRPLRYLIFLFSVLLPTLSCANDIDSILAKEQSPAGIVFEIVSGEEGLLEELLPAVNADIKRLRLRFPDIAIAIVTHGTEQFDLTIDKKKNSKAHSLVERLVKSNEVDVHVCGTHAEWYGVMPEDFPDYVNVSAEGPAQINDYQELGYILIELP